MLSENAKDIPGYEGLYAVTEDGRVYSHSRVVKAAYGRQYATQKGAVAKTTRE